MLGSLIVVIRRLKNHVFALVAWSVLILVFVALGFDAYQDRKSYLAEQEARAPVSSEIETPWSLHWCVWEGGELGDLRDGHPVIMLCEDSPIE